MDVKSSAALNAQLVLNNRRGRRECPIRRRRCNNDQIDVVWREPSFLKGDLRRFYSNVGSEFTVSRDVPTLDSGTLGDPLVVSVHHLGQIVIGENFLGQIPADAAYNRPVLCLITFHVTPPLQLCFQVMLRQRTL